MLIWLAISLIYYIYNNCELVCEKEKTYAIKPYGETFWYYIDNDELVDYYDENGTCGSWKYNEDKTDVVLAPAHEYERKSRSGG